MIGLALEEERSNIETSYHGAESLVREIEERIFNVMKIL
jgi:hypothetical protein